VAVLTDPEKRAPVVSALKADPFRQASGVKCSSPAGLANPTPDRPSNASSPAFCAQVSGGIGTNYSDNRGKADLVFARAGVRPWTSGADAFTRPEALRALVKRGPIPVRGACSGLSKPASAGDASSRTRRC
jgi:hypothetical protein